MVKYIIILLALLSSTANSAIIDDIYVGQSYILSAKNNQFELYNASVALKYIPNIKRGLYYWYQYDTVTKTQDNIDFTTKTHGAGIGASKHWGDVDIIAELGYNYSEKSVYNLYSDISSITDNEYHYNYRMGFHYELNNNMGFKLLYKNSNSEYSVNSDLIEIQFIKRLVE